MLRRNLRTSVPFPDLLREARVRACDVEVGEKSHRPRESARLKHRASPCIRRPSTQDEHSAQRGKVLQDRYRSIANCSGQRVGGSQTAWINVGSAARVLRAGLRAHDSQDLRHAPGLREAAARVVREVTVKDL